MRRTVHQPRTRRGRRGIVLVLCLVAIVLCGSVSLSVTQTIVLRQKRTENGAARVQAAVLADAALDRAAMLLVDEPKLEASAWEPELEDGQTGRVAIHITDSQDPARKHVTITARILSGKQIIARADLAADVQLSQKPM